jgi:23S rRNA G2445 N2-methylase RlmL
MNVDPLAIEAHEKGEHETDTIHTIELDNHRLKITKRSRVNAGLVVELNLNQPHVEYLPPGERAKTSLATSNGPHHVQIESSLMTVNGLARVLDVKTLVREKEQVYMKQSLTVWNDAQHTSHTTVRYFLPYETPVPK